ncbi:MAG: amidohydrolase [Chloroflexota bacterium]|nr:amidohydrolase family protein [Chloroflexota bacterium]MDE3100645.1 amidohydrolase [Chloroflexota bacterium]
MIGGAVVCDSQVHAPDRPSSVHVKGIDADELLRRMDEARVDRCVIVPLAAPLPDVSTNNDASLEIARRHPDRFAVMGRFDLTRPENVKLLAAWRSTPEMLGIRLSFARGRHRELLERGELGWFWSGAERAGVPLMLLVPDLLPLAGEIARRHPALRIVIDHMGLTPYVVYDDVMPALPPLLDLARYPNVAVKASALPDSVRDAYPFRSLHEPLRAVVEAFGHRRVFWGSDLTRLTVPYDECVGLFARELPFLSSEAREWILGRGVMEWIQWSTRPS